MVKKRRTKIIFVLMFTVFISSCGIFGQSIDQNNNPTELDAALVDPPDKDVPAVEDTVPGPSVLDLDNPSLYQYRDKNFSTNMVFEYEGDSTGDVNIKGEWFAGSPPSYSFTFDTTLPLWDGIVPFTYLGVNDLLYLVVSQSGCSAEAEDLENPYDDYFINGNYLTGDAPLVESGIVVNGTVVDRYEVTHANQLAEEDSAFYDFVFVDTSGSVYVDRISQVIVRFDQAGAGLDNSPGNEGSQEINITFQLDFVLNSNNAELVLPESCENVDPDSIKGDPGGVRADIPFPVVDDARNISAQTSMGIYDYDTLYDFDEIVSFYREEMSALGYSLDSELVIAPSALLQYSNDQGVVIVSINENENATGFSVTIVDNTSP